MLKIITTAAVIAIGAGSLTACGQTQTQTWQPLNRETINMPANIKDEGTYPYVNGLAPGTNGPVNNNTYTAYSAATDTNTSQVTTDSIVVINRKTDTYWISPPTSIGAYTSLALLNNTNNDNRIVAVKAWPVTANLCAATPEMKELPDEAYEGQEDCWAWNVTAINLPDGATKIISTSKDPVPSKLIPLLSTDGKRAVWRENQLVEQTETNKNTQMEIATRIQMSESVGDAVEISALANQPVEGGELFVNDTATWVGKPSPNATLTQVPLVGNPVVSPLKGKLNFVSVGGEQLYTATLTNSDEQTYTFQEGPLTTLKLTKMGTTLKDVIAVKPLNDGNVIIITINKVIIMNKTTETELNVKDEYGVNTAGNSFSTVLTQAGKNVVMTGTVKK